MSGPDVVADYTRRAWQLPYFQHLTFEEFTARYEVDVRNPLRPSAPEPVTAEPGPDTFECRVVCDYNVSVTPRNARLRVWVELA